MASEEKEPYFDGPSPTGQPIYYPGGNPQPYGQIPVPGHPAAPLQQPGPAFYNPHNFGAAAMAPNPWEAPVSHEQQHIHHSMNGPPATNDNTNLPGYGGPQAYFGGADSTSSASSSQQTTPERLQRQKMNDIPLNSNAYEPQLYTPHASSLFTPQTDGNHPVSQMYVPNTSSGFSPQQQNLSNSHFPPAGASGQHGYSHPPASSLFAPNSEMNNPGVQNYLNPVPHDAQPQIFTPNMQEANLHQAQIPEQENSLDGAAYKNESASPINPMDLHNGNSAYTKAAGDQSYMNMVYDNNHSGMSPLQSSNVTAYVSEEFQVGVGRMMIPASSGQDYDILHSQGTWEEQNNAPRQNLRQTDDVVPEGDATVRHDMNDGVHGAEGPIDMESDKWENDDGGNLVLNEEKDDAQHVDQVADEHLQENPELSSVNDPANNEQANADNLYNPAVNIQEQAALHESTEASTSEKTPSEEPNLQNAEQLDSTPPGGQAPLLSLDYENGSELTESDNGYAYGPITPNQQDTELHQSYDFNEDQGATEAPQFDAEQVDLVRGAEGHSAPQNTENVDVVEQPSESPIPADGLHPKQSVPEPGNLENPHHFASPNSAFESRFRSQSTGSNNSNASSQRSVQSQPNRVPQNRSLAAPFPAAALELSQTSRQETVPSSNPFSTDTMHSSHMTDPLTNPPVTSAPPARTVIPPIPDIVRPLPSGSGDENLRTGATAPLSSNQSLHSQVVRSRTAYPPEPPISVPQSLGATPNRPQPDLIQSPPEVASAQLRTSSEFSHPVIALKTSDVPPNVPEVSQAPTSIATSVNSDPYLSHSLHNAHHEIPVSSAPSQEPVIPQPTVQRNEPEQSPESSLPPSSAWTDDLRQHDADDRHHPDDSRRYEEDSRYRGRDVDRYEDSRRGSRDSRWGEDRMRDEYRRDFYGRDDDRYGGRWDSRDDRYRDERGYDDARSRKDHNSRPGSRQSGHPDPDYPRHHDDRGYSRDLDYRERDRYYRDRDRYYDDRYSDYDRRDPYYGYEDRRNDRYYDSYSRYRDNWYRHHYHDPYYYDQYYRDYQYNDRRHPEEDDSRSMYSERSKVGEHDLTLEREWHRRHDEQYDYRYYWGDRYHEDSLADESTLNAYDEWQTLPTVQARQTPAKFASTHTIVRFGPGGQLIKVQPNRPADNQPTTVEIHSLEILLEHTKEAEDLRAYPGPLAKDETHKNDVLQFTSARASESMKDMDLMDRRSTSLIWDFLALLVRQNGSVLGTDIAELLTKDHSGDFTLMQSPLEASRHKQMQLQPRTATPNSISDEPGGSSSPVPDQSEAKSTISSQSVEISSMVERNCNRFRELLLHGRKKDALDWAMKSGLWGHALLLASKTDTRTHAQVMLRFANSLPINDPLQTVYQLMSGRQPAAATCVSEEGWGDWRPHLAMILSNPTSSASLDMRAVLTMGDTLSTRGLLHAAHFCYLMSSTPLGYYGRPTTKMVLLGGNHTLPFKEFASWDSIRRTEIYEYAISLGKQQKSSAPTTTLPSFQLYKFIYACKLAEYGQIAQAFHYCECIARSVCKTPSLYSTVLVNQLVNVCDQLRHHDPQIHAGVKGAGNVRWLETLRKISEQMKSGAIVPRAHAASSLLTTSNTPSVVSTSPTTDSQTDDIHFSARTPDLEDSEEVPDSGMQNLQLTSQGYGQTMPNVSMYSGPPTSMHVSGQPAVMIPDMGLDQPSTPSSYNQDPNLATDQDAKGYQTSGGYYHHQQQPQQFLQPSGQNFAQPQIPMGNFDQLSSQANPLTVGYVPQVPDSRPQYQHQNSLGFNPEQHHPTVEEHEQSDQIGDYYDYMANANKSHHGRAASPRSRTISQSSQRSRASTIKGYDRTTPTAMVNHTDKGRRSRTTSENSGGRRSRKTSGEQTHQKVKPKKNDDDDGVKKSGSWSILSWFSRRQSKQIHLPEDKENNIVWDDQKQRWVDKNATEEENAPPAPPPMDNALPSASAIPLQPNNVNQNQNNGQALPPGEPQLTANRFSLKNLGGNRTMYKNAFSTSSKPVAAPPPADILPGLQNAMVPKPTGFMVPNPVPTSQPQRNQDPGPAATPMHAPDAAQSIQTSAVPTMTSQEPGGAPAPMTFYNPTQFAGQPNLVYPTQPMRSQDGGVR